VFLIIIDYLELQSYFTNIIILDFFLTLELNLMLVLPYNRRAEENLAVIKSGDGG